MTLGVADRQGNLLDDVVRFCDERLDERSIYAFMHRERERLFPDEEFGDLFSDVGRRSVPPSVVATVMVLQRLEGLSDREAVERYCFDTRWRYATGVGGYDTGTWTDFAHTVLVDMRERLRRSKRPDRIFESALDAARQAGIVGRRRALDSTPLYDAVATMDTVTLIRSAIRGLLKVADDELETELRSVLRAGDDYSSPAKPTIDWDDAGAREQLVDSRAKDAYSCLCVLDGRELDASVGDAARLLATVVGQDLEAGTDGVLRIARKVAKDRVISTVDPEARHGHKTAARSFDGYKGHVAVDPDSEIITKTVVTAGNAGDASVAEDLIADLVTDDDTVTDDTVTDDTVTDDTVTDDTVTDDTVTDDTVTVYGDNAYGTGEFQSRLEDEGFESRCKTQRPAPRDGLFTKDDFEIDLVDDTVTCPAGVKVRIHRHIDGGGMAYFGSECITCARRDDCTRSATGRHVAIHPYEPALARARDRQRDPTWVADYRATRPKVERKLAHLMRRKHGGRKARVRGTEKVDADFRLLAGAANLARLATIGLRSSAAGWALAPG